MAGDIWTRVRGLSAGIKLALAFVLIVVVVGMAVTETAGRRTSASDGRSAAGAPSAEATDQTSNGASGSPGSASSQGSGDKGDKDGKRADEQPEPEPEPEPKPKPRFLVTRVVDGDTIEVAYRGSIEDVRLIGIDTPETVHPSVGVECFGPQASAFTTSQLQGRRVRLELDVERRDHYGRLLAYVWLDGKLFNAVLVKRGYATVSTYPPNVRHVERFVAAQRAARSAGRGFWGSCGASNPSQPGGGSQGSSAAAGGASSSGNCDPNYKGACIPSYPPDLDCADVPANFNSTGSDPHGFDADGDGVACES